MRLLCPITLPNPFISAIRPAFQQDVAIRPIPAQLQIRFSDAGEALVARVEGALGQNSPIARGVGELVDSAYNGSLSMNLMKLYVVGVLAVLLWFVYSNLRFRNRLKADRIEPIDGQLLGDYERLCRERGVKPLPVYFTDPLPSACLVGVFRPYIALPLTAKPQEAIQVLTHEVCHFKGRDQVWALLRLACCALHWFNPLVWLAACMSRTDGELACDDRVIAQLDGKARLAYANVLLLAATRRYAPSVGVLATGMTMTGRRLKTRVSTILRHREVKRGAAIAFALAGCMLLAGAFATREARPSFALPAHADTAALLRPSAVNSNEEAIAYAKRVWAMPQLDASTEDASWDVDREKEGFLVYASWDAPASPLLRLRFSPDGALRELYNMHAFVDYATPRAWYDQDEAARDALEGFVLDWAKAAGLSDDVRPLRLAYIGDKGMSEYEYITFHGQSEAAMRAGDPELYSLFVVQLHGDVARIVRYQQEALHAPEADDI